MHENDNFKGDNYPLAEELESALSELHEHNSKHTGIGGVFRKIIGSLGGSEQKATGTDTNEENDLIDSGIDFSVVDNDLEGELSEDLTVFNVLPIFSKIGLGLQDGENISNTSDKNNDKRGHAKQVLKIVDVNLFRTYIDRHADLISNSESISNMIRKIYDDILRDIENTEGQYRDKSIEKLIGINPVLKNINFRGIKPDLELGEAFINWSKKLEFDDYLLSRKMGLTGGKNFDAFKWHTDSPKDKLILKWESLLSYYSGLLKKYGHENDLTKLVTMEIKDALSAFNVWINNPPKSTPKEYLLDSKSAYESIAEKIKKLHL